MGRDLKLNPDRGGSYLKDSEGRHHLVDASGVCLDGFEEGEYYEPKTYEEQMALVQELHPELAPKNPADKGA